MQKQELSLTYNLRIAKNEQSPILLMLHGYGSHENDLFGMTDALPQNLHIVSVRAPQEIGFGGFAWYDINFGASGDKINNLEQANDALKSINDFITEFRECYNLHNAPLWLMGFSQGTILSYAYTFNNPQKVQKVIALSGYILKGLVPGQYKADEMKHLDFFISHGTKDPVLPIEAARQSIKILETLNISHKYFEYPEGHGVSAENMHDLKKWLNERV